MRIPIQRLQNGGGIERGRQAHRQRHAAGAGHQVREHVRRQRQALAFCQCPDRAARQHLRRRLDVERIMPRQRQPVRAFDVDVEIGGARAASVERQRHRGPLLGGEFDGGYGVTRHLHRARGLDADAVIAGRALDIVEIETHRALVAVEQEARQRCRQHHGIAHRDINGRPAELGRIPRHGHHACGAGEFRNIKTDFRGAVGANRDDPRIERQRFLRRRRALQLGTGGIAAGPDLAARTLHAVDQLPVEVADLGRQAALAEIVVIGRGRLVVGQVENADVDGSDDDLGILAGIEPAEFDRDLQRGAGPHQGWRRQRDLQRARLLVDAEPF